MNIRKAEAKDCPRLLELLDEIRALHQAARPDIFRAGTTKYSLSNLEEMLADPARPIFVAVNEADALLGYAMCLVEEIDDSPVRLPYKRLYLDDLCVAEEGRKHGVGGVLVEYCKDFARAEGCSRVELNVWEFPGSAFDFYTHHGFTTQRREMEFWL